jgi:hypothetical protein
MVKSGHDASHLLIDWAMRHISKDSLDVRRNVAPTADSFEIKQA